jgi:hypothetical protein
MFDYSYTKQSGFSFPNVATSPRAEMTEMDFSSINSSAAQVPLKSSETSFQPQDTQTTFSAATEAPGASKQPSSKEGSESVCPGCSCSCHRIKQKNKATRLVTKPTPSILFLKNNSSSEKGIVHGYMGDKIKYGSAGNVVGWNGVSLTGKNIDQVLSLEQKQQASQDLFEYFRMGGFPYPKYDLDELKEDWENLKRKNSKDVVALEWMKHSPEEVLLSNKILYGNKIFRNFHGENFFSVRGQLKSERSMLEAFESDQILKSVLDNRLGITYKERFNMHGSMLRQGFRSTRSCYVASIFNSMIAKYIYDKYVSPNKDGSKNVVFDYSMGFGHRMLGAMAANNNLYYIACDPWKSVVATNVEISKFLGFESRVDLRNCGSETIFEENALDAETSKLFNQHRQKVNLAFSSPPYFTKEIYDNNGPGQACYGGKSYDEFIDSWWRRTMQNIDNLLNPETGVFVLNMVGDGKHSSLLADMMTVAEQLGFKEIDRCHIFMSKSHFSPNKKDNPNKREPIVIMKKSQVH